jgi:hypothetical protein
MRPEHHKPDQRDQRGQSDRRPDHGGDLSRLDESSCFAIILDGQPVMTVTVSHPIILAADLRNIADGARALCMGEPIVGTIPM